MPPLLFVRGLMAGYQLIPEGELCKAPHQHGTILQQLLVLMRVLARLMGQATVLDMAVHSALEPFPPHHFEERCLRMLLLVIPHPCAAQGRTRWPLCVAASQLRN
jgi:hypothetical protein